MTPDTPPSKSPQGRRLLRVGAVVVLALCATYGSILVYRSSFMICGKRYFCLFDDAMISLTYARNWVDGHGLVWNVGEEPVEGYTNFGWLAILAAVELLGLSKINTCLVIQILGVAICCGYVFAAMRLGVSMRFSSWAILLGAALSGFYYRLVFLSVTGMETGILALLLTFALIWTSRSLETHRVSPLPFVMLAAACLVRMDMVLCLASISFVLLVADRRLAFRTLGYSLLALAPLAAHILWRHSYYGEWLPNTYYAKLYLWPLSDRLVRGTLESASSLLHVLPALVILGIACIARRSSMTFLVLLTYALLLAYHTWVGGDVWRLDRFVGPIVPAVLVTATGHLGAFLKPQEATKRVGFGRCSVVVAFAAAILFCMNMQVRREALFLKPPLCKQENHDNIARIQAIRQAAKADILTGLCYAGSAPYFVEGRYLDFLGKSDKFVARLPIRTNWRTQRAIRPGHMKWSWPYAIGERKPDFVTDDEGQWLLYSCDFQHRYEEYHLRTDNPDLAEPTFWIRMSSPRIDWSAIEMVQVADTGPQACLDDPCEATITQANSRRPYGPR